jgi:hypothetical protein
MGIILATLYWLLLTPILICFCAILICILVGIFATNDSPKHHPFTIEKAATFELLGIKLW